MADANAMSGTARDAGVLSESAAAANLDLVAEFGRARS
jgi:hypothetical protein